MITINLQFSIVLLLAGAAVAAEGDRVKFSKVAERAAETNRSNILEEIKKLGDHEWAGEYYAGDGRGVNTTLAIARDAGYVFEWHGCLGLYDRNYGTATWTNGHIRLSFTFENKRQGFQGIASELIPVSWGPRRYLVPADDIVGFCNDVNNGREPRNHVYGFYLLRRGDEQKETGGFPSVPKEYRSYLLTEPIEATIAAIGASTTRPSVAEWKFKDTTVTLDAGTNQGVRVGMKFLVMEPWVLVESVRVTRVEGDRSDGVMTQIEGQKPGPQAGWRLSTQSPWHNRNPEKRKTK